MRCFISSLVMVSFLLIASSLNATGLGISMTYGVGSTDYDLYEADANRIGLNFVFDSNVAMRGVFNYRLNVGAEFFSHEYYEYDYYHEYEDYSSHVEGIRIVTDHTFGFGIVKSKIVRLWMGPNFRFGFIVGEDEGGFCVGGGITALGLNFNFGRVVTLGLEAGYQFYADLYFDDVVQNEYEFDYDSYEGSSTGLNNMFVVKLSILLRIRDNYDDL